MSDYDFDDMINKWNECFVDNAPHAMRSHRWIIRELGNVPENVILLARNVSFNHPIDSFISSRDKKLDISFYAFPYTLAILSKFEGHSNCIIDLMDEDDNPIVTYEFGDLSLKNIGSELDYTNVELVRYNAEFSYFNLNIELVYMNEDDVRPIQHLKYLDDHDNEYDLQSL